MVCYDGCMRSYRQWMGCVASQALENGICIVLLGAMMFLLESWSGWRWVITCYEFSLRYSVNSIRTRMTGQAGYRLRRGRWMRHAFRRWLGFTTR